MYRKLIYLVTFVFGLGLILTSVSDAADPNLIGWWKLDETSGLTAADSSVFGNDGTLPNMAGNEWTNGIVGGALEFDGTDDYVSVPSSSSLQLTSALTLAGWIKADSWGSGDEVDPIARKGEGNPNNYQLAVVDGRATFYLDGGEADDDGFEGNTVLNTGQWYHVAATWNGSTVRVYVDGVIDNDPSDLRGDNIGTDTRPFYIGGRSGTDLLDGILDDIRIYNRVLRDVEILGVMAGDGAEYPLASGPNPADGVMLEDTWASLSWSPGPFALSHDVYFGDNFDDVEAGTEATFQGNQAATYFAVGSARSPYLVPGVTYYWRVDEVNDTEPNSPWKGDVWSFSIPPKTAYAPEPADGAGSVDPNVELSWTGGFGARIHYVYFGDNFDDVNNATGAMPNPDATYTPGTLKLANTYYWRVDESDAIDTYKGEVWSFTTEGGIGSPNPSNGAVDVKQTQILTWSPHVYAASHEVYFGADEDAVKNADTSSPEYKGTRALGSETYDPGMLEWDSTYYWRIDEVNNTNSDSPWVGPLWSFTTANFLVVDDFEDYDIGNNEIWWMWIDGLGYASHPSKPPHPGNGTGSMVGDESTPSYTEETIVHGGNQSMPVFYDNSILRYSEVEKTLTYPSDWTEKGVNKLSIWFRGISDNAAETLYVALNGSAVVNHDNPNAAQITTWTEWTIDLQAFADQGVSLANVNTIALGIGNKKNPVAGGSGTMYFDDIRLYPPPPEPLPIEVHVDVDDAGSQVELEEGQILVVTLESNPTTGYRWEQAENQESILEQMGEAEFKPSDTGESPLVGAGGWEIFRFKAISAGQMTLQLVYHRSWEEGVEPLKTFSLQVVVR